MFSRIRMSGAWAHGSTVSHLEFEALDAFRPSAIDGDGGGTYAPSALLSIGGLHVRLNPTTLTLAATAMAVSAPGTWTAAQTHQAAINMSGANVVLDATSNIVCTPTRSVVRAECGMPALSGTDWAFTSAGIIQSGAAAGHYIIFPITAPHGSTLTAFSALVQAGGGHGALPANMPALVVYKRNLSTGGTTTVGSANDTSASTAAYEAVHSVSVTGLSEVIDLATNRYYAIFTNEFGANSASGFVVFGAKRTTTVGTLDIAS